MIRGDRPYSWRPARPTIKEALFLLFCVVFIPNLMRLPGSVLDAGYSLWIFVGILALVVGSIVARSFLRAPELPEPIRSEIEALARRDLASGEVEDLEFDVRDAIAVVDPTIDETTYLLDVGGGNVLCLGAHQLPGYGIDDRARAITPLPRRALTLTRAVPSRQVLACRSRGERIRPSRRLPYWTDVELEGDRVPTEGSLYAWDFAATGADGKAPLVEPGDRGA